MKELRRSIAVWAVALIAAGVAGCAELPAGDDTAATASKWEGCDAYQTQREAQRAWRHAGRPAVADRDGDGRVCETLPAARNTGGADGCVRTGRVVVVRISRTRSPETVAHFQWAQRHGYPRVLTIDRRGAAERRKRSLAGIPTRPGKQRDEYPPAMSVENAGRAHVRLIDATDNARSGSSMGSQLARYCDGTKFRLVAAP